MGGEVTKHGREEEKKGLLEVKKEKKGLSEETWNTIIKIIRDNPRFVLEIYGTTFVPHEWFSCLPGPIKVCEGEGESKEITVKEAVTKGLFTFFDLLNRMCELGMTSSYVPTTKEQTERSIKYTVKFSPYFESEIEIKWTSDFTPYNYEKLVTITPEILWENFKYYEKEGKVTKEQLENFKKFLEKKYNFKPSITSNIASKKTVNLKEISEELWPNNIRKKIFTEHDIKIYAIEISRPPNPSLFRLPIIISEDNYCDVINNFYELLKKFKILPFEFE